MHLKPDEENNICNYCHRKLVYEFSVDYNTNKGSDSSIWYQQFHRESVRKERQKEKTLQKINDRIVG